MKMCMLGKPLVAGVKGRAVGLGAVLLAYCDIVVAEPCASFMTPYPKLGCFPEAAATTLLPQVIGLAPVCESILNATVYICMFVFTLMPTNDERGETEYARMKMSILISNEWNHYSN